MKKNSQYLLLLLLGYSLTLLSACEDETPQYYHEKEFELEDFTGVDLGSAFEIEIKEAAEFKVIAKGEDQDLNDLEMRVENNVLNGSYLQNRRNRKRTLIQIQMPVLREANLHGASHSSISGFSSEEDSLELHLSGASELLMDADWKFLEIDISGASNANVDGQANKVKASVSGASNLNSRDLSASIIEIAVSGASEAKIIVDNELRGSVNGASELKYTGNPAVVDVDVAQDSKIRKE